MIGPEISFYQSIFTHRDYNVEDYWKIKNHATYSIRLSPMCWPMLAPHNVPDNVMDFIFPSPCQRRGGQRGGGAVRASLRLRRLSGAEDIMDYLTFYNMQSEQGALLHEPAAEGVRQRVAVVMIKSEPRGVIEWRVFVTHLPTDASRHWVTVLQWLSPWTMLAGVCCWCQCISWWVCDSRIIETALSH